LPALTPDAGLEQFIAPVALAPCLARAGNALIGRSVIIFYIIEGLDGRRGHSLEGERTGNASLPLLRQRLVIESLDLGWLVVRDIC
jgi:hypothetical protein